MRNERAGRPEGQARLVTGFIGVNLPCSGQGESGAAALRVSIGAHQGAGFNKSFQLTYLVKAR